MNRSWVPISAGLCFLSLIGSGLPWSPAYPWTWAIATLGSGGWGLVLGVLLLEAIAEEPLAGFQNFSFSAAPALLIAAGSTAPGAATLVGILPVLISGRNRLASRAARSCPTQAALLLLSIGHGPLALVLSGGLWFLWMQIWQEVSLRHSGCRRDPLPLTVGQLAVTGTAIYLGLTQDVWHQPQIVCALPLLGLVSPSRWSASRSSQPSPESDPESLTHGDTLDGFAQQLADLGTLGERAEFIVNRAHSAVPSRTVCLFLCTDTGQLERRAFISEGKPEDIALGWSEIIANVYETGKHYWGPVYRSKRPSATSPLGSGLSGPPSETFATVLAVGPGALFVGRQHIHNHGEVEFLRHLAGQAKVNLRLAWDQEMQSRASYAMEGRLATLQKLLEGSRQLSRLLPVENLLRMVSGIAKDGLAHDYGAIWTLTRAPKESTSLQASIALDWWPTESAGSPRLPALDTQHQESILDDLLHDRPPRAITPYASLLLAPIRTPQQASSSGENPANLWGIMILAAQPLGCYGPEHGTLLNLLAAQFGVAVENTRLYHDVLLTQERLKQSQAELTQASKLSAIGQLAAGVAHELNSPLGAIALSLDTLQIFAPDLNQDARDQVANADQALRNAQRIVEHLLNYSRKSIEQQRATVDLGQVCQAALELSSAQIEKSGVRIHFAMPKDNVAVQAVAVELQQVVVNLLLNATQAYDGRPGKVALEVFQTPLGCGIRVTDWAGGVPEALVGKIFDPFFTTKPVGKGTGLGLSVSQEIVNKFGGRIELQNRSTVGASFAVLFPN